MELRETSYSLDLEYRKLISDVLRLGHARPDRTGVGTVSLFGLVLRNIPMGVDTAFPILSSKKVNFSAIAAELTGFLNGYDSAAQFRAAGTKIWDQNANETPSWLNNPNRKGTDDLGRIYGKQWIDWRAGPNVVCDNEGNDYHYPEFDGYKTVNQIETLLDGLVKDPYGRRHLVSAWNPAELDQMSLPPCHYAFQCYVRDGEFEGLPVRYLDMLVHMRSVDMFLGLPFNISSYAALGHLLAHLASLRNIRSEINYLPGLLSFTLGDAHVYNNHIDACKTLLGRRFIKQTAQLAIDPDVEELKDVSPESFILIDYVSDSAIKAPMAV